MQTLTMEELEQVHGAAVPVAVWKVGAWALGAAFGTATVVVANKLL